MDRRAIRSSGPVKRRFCGCGSSVRRGGGLSTSGGLMAAIRLGRTSHSRPPRTGRSCTYGSSCPITTPTRPRPVSRTVSPIRGRPTPVTGPALARSPPRARARRVRSTPRGARVRTGPRRPRESGHPSRAAVPPPARAQRPAHRGPPALPAPWLRWLARPKSRCCRGVRDVGSGRHAGSFVVLPFRRPDRADWITLRGPSTTSMYP